MLILQSNNHFEQIDCGNDVLYLPICNNDQSLRIAKYLRLSLRDFREIGICEKKKSFVSSRNNIWLHVPYYIDFKSIQLVMHS